MSLRKTAMHTMPGTWPPADMLNMDAYHWLHSERSSKPGIAEWLGNVWHCIGEAQPITPQELARRGWEYLGPCKRPKSHYLDN
jgi:hypothetical protein